jgi:hypothetical protein
MKTGIVFLPPSFDGSRIEKFSKRQPPKKAKTDAVLELSIKETGLPVEMEVLRKVFYRIHGGNNNAANIAWNRSIKESGLEVDEEGRLFGP